MMQGKLREAEDFFRKALSVKPDYSDVWNDLGCILESQDKTEEAVSCFQKALEFNRNHKVAQNNLGRVMNDN